jgi:hypothetical protein
MAIGKGTVIVVPFVLALALLVVIPQRSGGICFLE